MSTDAFDLGLQHLLAAPSRAHTILTCVTATLRDEDPHAPLTLGVLNEVLHRVSDFSQGESDPLLSPGTPKG